MWSYDKKLIHPVRIKKPDPMSAKIIISQLGGPHGELGAATRYLQQRYSMPYGELIGILTDVGICRSKRHKKAPRATGEPFCYFSGSF